MVYNNCKWNTYNLEIFLVINSELERLLTTPFLFYFLIFFSNCFYYTVFSLLFSRLQDRKVNKSKKNSYLLNVPFFSLFFPHSDLLTTNWKARFTQITISFVDCRSDTYKKVLFYLCNIRHCQRGGIYWTKKLHQDNDSV